MSGDFHRRFADFPRCGGAFAAISYFESARSSGPRQRGFL
jgi:hypothetical protein